MLQDPTSLGRVLRVLLRHPAPRLPMVTTSAKAAPSTAPTGPGAGRSDQSAASSLGLERAPAARAPRPDRSRAGPRAGGEGPPGTRQPHPAAHVGAAAAIARRVTVCRCHREVVRAADEACGATTTMGIRTERSAPGPAGTRQPLLSRPASHARVASWKASLLC